MGPLLGEKPRAAPGTFDVRNGSKAEILIASTCCPLYPRKPAGERTSQIVSLVPQADLGPRAEQFDEFVVDEAGLEQS